MKTASALLCAVLLLLCVSGAGAASDGVGATDTPRAKPKPQETAPAASENTVEAKNTQQENTVPAENKQAAEDDAPAGPGPADAGRGAPGVDMDQVMMAAGAVATVCAMAGGWFLMNQGGPKKRKFKGDAVFLVGPCDSGKTAVMFQLRDGDSGDKLRPTHSSMTFNEDTFAVAGANCKPVRIIDFPGHSRLRPQLFDMIEDCAALVFVIDACAFSTTGRGTLPVYQTHSATLNDIKRRHVCIYGN